MRIASVADVKAKLSGYIEASKTGPIIVTKNGKPVAVLLSVHDEDEIERLLLAYSPRLQRVLAMAERQIRAGKGITHEAFWHEFPVEA
ncbi:MAG: type II toxin-antitoxin system Phd/YefM family antitoxin [Armatimonadota bacterium]|nr:type II toxin-antitoxin system Phd/YefM family antitoxin [Armatimonadota bacterium]MDR7519281.1 type II toxin-antitoxin system Phd/YefM family antitoxin [Armatimonadota bacterium]MDR7551079.1 type II toxin-antitoxin system Phd/YefM family antitoxin [Armatimonadota bacterium]